MNFLQDVKFGWRMIAKSPLLSLVAIVSLGLAIGANTAIYTIWNAVFDHSIPVADPPSLVNLYTQDSAAAAGSGGVSIPFLGVSNPNFQDYSQDTAVFSGLYLYQDVGATLTRNGVAENIPIEIATGNYFQVLGVPAYRGRVFTAAETATDGQGAVVVLSQAFWARRFGSDPALIGKTITLDHQNFLVAGVAPPGFNGTQTLFGPDLWAPMSMHDTLLGGVFKDFYHIRRALIFNAVARLRPGVSLASARAAVAVTASQLERQYPVDNHARTATLLPLTESAVGPNQRANLTRGFAMMLAVVGLVLLIACANVANLLLARALGRRREISVRLALGATRARLVRQLLVESLLMGLLAGAAGLLFARWARDLLWAHRPPGLLNPAFDLSLNAHVLLYAAALSLATGLLFGLAPAWQCSRGSSLAQRLNQRGEAAASGPSGLRLRAALLVGEVAFALIALIGAGLFLASLRQIQRTDPGFDAAHLASLNLNLGTAGLDPAHQETFRRALLDRVQSLPGVAAATLASGTPLNASGFARTYTVEGEVPVPGKGSRFVSVESIAPASFFATYGIPLVAGRDFTPSDDARSQPVIIVNQAFARQAWPGQSAVGKRIKFFRDAGDTLVVGVARDSKYFSLTENPTQIVYLPFAQYNSPTAGLTVRAQGPPAALLPALRQTVRALDPTLAITNLETAATPIAASLWPARMTADLLSVLALLALTLAAIGIYGVMAFGVRQSQREIGIRMAIGATPASVLRQYLVRGMLTVSLGLALGVAGALLLGRWITAFLVGITPADPAVYLEYSALFAAISLAAAYFPARKATQTDPVRILREE